MKVPKAKKKPSGKWYIQLRLGGESIYVDDWTEKGCTQQAQLVKAEYLAGKRMSAQNGILLKHAVRNYIESRRSRLSPATIQGYEKILNNNFQSLMEVPLSKLTWKMCDDAIAAECSKTSRRGKPYSAKTVHNSWMLIASVLKINRVSFDIPLSLPEVKRKPVSILPAEEVFRAVKGTAVELPCLLAMWLTMTISEIRGLTKSRSIHNGKISIVDTVVDIGGKPVWKEGGKEEERTRTQAIPPYIQNLIDQVEGDVICPMSSQAVNKRLQRLLEKAGLPVISFHKLRHISASTMALLKIPTNYAQEKGGWKTDHTMKRVYTHTFEEGRLAADRAMDDYFSSIIAADKNATKNATGSAKGK